jgi:hypothetical protein
MKISTYQVFFKSKFQLIGVIFNEKMGVKRLFLMNIESYQKAF